MLFILAGDAEEIEQDCSLLAYGYAPNQPDSCYTWKQQVAEAFDGIDGE